MRKWLQISVGSNLYVATVGPSTFSGMVWGNSNADSFPFSTFSCWDVSVYTATFNLLYVILRQCENFLCHSQYCDYGSLVAALTHISAESYVHIYNNVIQQTKNRTRSSNPEAFFHFNIKMIFQCLKLSS